MKQWPRTLQKHFASKTFCRDKHGGKSRCYKKEKQIGGEVKVEMGDEERESELIWMKWMRIRSIYLELV